MHEIYIVKFQRCQFTFPNTRLEKRQQDGVIPAVFLRFKQQRLVFIPEKYRGVFLLFPRPRNRLSGIPGNNVIFFQELEEMPVVSLSCCDALYPILETDVR